MAYKYEILPVSYLLLRMKNDVSETVKQKFTALQTSVAWKGWIFFFKPCSNFKHSIRAINLLNWKCKNSLSISCVCASADVEWLANDKKFSLCCSLDELIKGYADADALCDHSYAGSTINYV